MGLFSSDKEKDTDAAETAADTATATQTKDETAENSQPAQPVDNTLHDVLVKPHITEKASYLSNDGVYTFVIKESANKLEVKQAVKEVYGVDVRKVRIVKLPKKVVRSRHGKTGTKGGLKKAYVYLNEGDSIELM